MARHRETRAPPTPPPRAATTAQFVWLREICSRNGRTLRAVACCTVADQVGGRVLQLIRIVGVDRQDGVTGRRRARTSAARQPVGELVERVARRVREARGEQRLVAPQRLDEPRAGLVRGGGDLPHERRRFERRAAVGHRADDQQPLPGLKVEPDSYRELGIGAQLLLVHCTKIVIRRVQSRGVCCVEQEAAQRRHPSSELLTPRFLILAIGVLSLDVARRRAAVRSRRATICRSRTAPRATGASSRAA